jgi:hypothetical protein
MRTSHVWAAALLLGCHSGAVTSNGPPAGGSGGGGGSGAKPDSGDFTFQPGDGSTVEAGSGPLPDEKTCAEQVHAAQPVPVDLLLLVDGSSSMGEAVAGGRSKQVLVRDALISFVKDPRSTGLGIGLQYFPLPQWTECGSDADCGPFDSSAGKPEWWGCRPRTVCAPPKAPLGTAVNICAPASAAEDCSGGTSCVPLGYCAASGWPCFNVGDACQSGRANDVCKAFPRVCNGSQICNARLFRELAIPISDLPGAAGALTIELAAREPSGATPMGPAIEAYLAHLAERATTHPGRTAALVLATDGVPQGCGPADQIATIAGRLSAAAAARPAVTTYVIGVIDKADPNVGPGQALAQLATAGGTGAPFLLSPAADLTQTFLAALEQIRGRALPCEFSISKNDVSMVDFGRVNLRFRGASGDRDILYVGKADRCDPMRGGWYYDVDPMTGTPTRVITCPATCAALKSDVQGRIDLRFGCKTRVIE